MFSDFFKLYDFMCLCMSFAFLRSQFFKYCLQISYKPVLSVIAWTSSLVKKFPFVLGGVGVEKILVFMEILTNFYYSSSIGSILIYDVKSFSSVYSILPTI